MSSKLSDVCKDECIILNKCINSLIHATMQYYVKAVEILKRMTFIGGNVDPCLYAKKSKKGKVYIALYINDNLMVGDIVAIDDAIADLRQNMLELKIVEGL